MPKELFTNRSVSTIADFEYIAKIYELVIFCHKLRT